MKIQRNEFVKFIFGLREVLPKWAPPFTEESSINAWFEAFRDCEIETMREVYVYARDNLREFPSINELLEIYDFCDDTFSATPFEDLITLVQRFSSNESRWPALDAPMKELVRRLGGGSAIGDWDIDHYPFKRKLVNQLWDEIKVSCRAGRLEPQGQQAISESDVLRMISSHGDQTN